MPFHALSLSAPVRRLLVLMSFSLLLSACVGSKPQVYEHAEAVLDLENYLNGLLAEDFLHDDGETERRVWAIRKSADGRYTGTADDIIGQARDQAGGHSLDWSYALALPVGESVYKVSLDEF